MLIIDHSLKTCCRCGETKQVCDGFYSRKRRGRTVSDGACKECVKADNRVRDTAARRARGAKPLRRVHPMPRKLTPVVRHLPPRKPHEALCDAAFIGWRGPVSGGALVACL